MTQKRVKSCIRCLNKRGGVSVLSKVLSWLSLSEESDITFIGGCQAHYESKTFMGYTPDGRYVHRTELGRATYHPAYYAIDGTLLRPHMN